MELCTVDVLGMLTLTMLRTFQNTEDNHHVEFHRELLRQVSKLLSVYDNFYY